MMDTNGGSDAHEKKKKSKKHKNKSKEKKKKKKSSSCDDRDSEDERVEKEKLKKKKKLKNKADDSEEDLEDDVDDPALPKKVQLSQLEQDGSSVAGKRVRPVESNASGFGDDGPQKKKVWLKARLMVQLSNRYFFFALFLSLFILIALYFPSYSHHNILLNRIFSPNRTIFTAIFPLILTLVFLLFALFLVRQKNFVFDLS